MLKNGSVVQLLVAGLILSPFATSLGRPGQGAPRILVGPNILVSRDGDVAHVELMLATNPRNPKQLLGGAITATRPAGGWACKSYTSADGGYGWFDSTFPEQVEVGGGDPQTAFTPDGGALFMALSRTKDETGRDRSGIFVYRSEDGGRTWGKAVIAAFGADHPQVVVDHTGGKHQGRVYIGYLHGFPEYQISVVRSDDGGRTFGKPVLAASGKGVIGINVTSMHLLGDGTLVVPYGDFDFHQTREPRKESRSTYWTVLSTDGGETYSEPRKVASNYVNLEHRLTTFGMFTADQSSGKYHDRAYGVWTDYSSGSGRVLFTHSTDKGLTWTKPIPIDDTGPTGSVQYEAQLVVNKDGILGVTWFDTRTQGDLSHYDEYFTASLDGGHTFLKPARISSSTSQSFGTGNMQIIPSAWHLGNLTRLSFISSATRWRAAGDYMGLAVDADGVFHPFWADARSGTYQVWTAAVRVERDAAQIVRPPADLSAADVTKLVDIVNDPSRYDLATHELEMPLRLKNLSTNPMYPPITVTVANFGSGMGEMLRDYAPSVLNASNGKSGAGAIMDYSKSLGDFAVLPPGGLSDAVVWRLKVGDPEKVPDMHLSVNASTKAEGAPSGK